MEEPWARRRIAQHATLAYPVCSLCHIAGDAHPTLAATRQLLGLSQSQSDQSSPDDSETCTASCERLCHGEAVVHGHPNRQAVPGGWLPDEPAEKAAKHLPTVARDAIIVTIAL